MFQYYSKSMFISHKNRGKLRRFKLEGSSCEVLIRWLNRTLSVLTLQVGEAPSPRLSGLLTRDFDNGTTRWYNGVEREVELDVESRSIFLPNVTCDDSGVYMCHLAAPVGEQNREGLVLLTLTGETLMRHHFSQTSQAGFPNF